jgi:uncharacterized FAD-dependent dehydrogenase
VGSALHEKYGVRADMKNFAVCVRVDVVKDRERERGKKKTIETKYDMPR